MEIQSSPSTEKYNEALYKAGEKALKSGDFAKAIEKFEQLLKRSPAYKDSVKLLEQARKQKSEREKQQQYEQAMVHLNAGRWQQAIGVFEALLAQDPNYRNAKMLLWQAKARKLFAEKKGQVIAAGGGIAIILILCGIAGITAFIGRNSAETPNTTQPQVAAVTDTPTPTPTPKPDIPTPIPPSPTESSLATPLPDTTAPTPLTSELIQEMPPDTSTPVPPTSEPAQKSSPSPEPPSPTEPPPVATETPTQTPSPTTTPTPPLPGKIAVPVFENGIYNIYLAKAEDNWQPELLFERASQPAFSKDGRGMVVHSWGHKDWGQRLIYLTDYTDLSSFQKKTGFIEDGHPSFNKQGNEIVFHSRQESRGRDPIIITMGTYPDAPLVKLGEGTNPDWLGDHIIYYKSSPSVGLYIMDRHGGGTNVPIIKTGKTVPAAAPDGDTVAVPLKRGGSNHWQIFTFAVNQGESSLAQLTSTVDADNYLPTWSPDGQHIAFASNREGNWAVWVMNADGADLRELFDLPGSVDGYITDVNVESTLSFGWSEERIAWGP